MKKNLLIVGIVLVGLMGIIGFVVFFGKIRSKGANFSPKVAATPTPKIQKELSSDELPLVRLIPRADKKEVTLEIKNIKNANLVEYELTYLSKGITRGVIGTINLKEGETEISRKILLGTCSRNVCKYDEDVTTGNLLLRLRGKEGVIKITAPFDLDSKDYNLQVQGWLIQ
ncbi:MAG: hypothetical protein ACPLKP_01100 [Microgenomates group bacterium]